MNCTSPEEWPRSGGSSMGCWTQNTLEGYISRLTWERLGSLQEELEITLQTGTSGVALLSLLPRNPALDLVHLVEEVLPDLKKNNAAVWVVDHTSPSEDFSTLLDKVEHMAGETLSDLPKVDIMSNFLFIFTSGTTGLSKAARVGHLKAIVSMAFFQMCGATSDDIIYITLPLYHMSASLLGIGGCIHLGATCVLKKKFSASQFWKDCLKHNVTVVQYIGELCRYLLNQSVTYSSLTTKQNK